MVLSDSAITRLIADGQDRDRPLRPRADAALRASMCASTGSFASFATRAIPYIDVKLEQEDMTELVEVDDGEPFILHPGEFVLGSTLERVTLPDDLVARLEGKSSLGRLGLAHPLDGRLHRSGLGRARDARALERREPADHDLPGDEDRPALVRADGGADRPSVRLERPRLEVPGPARPDAEPVLEELR